LTLSDVLLVKKTNFANRLSIYYVKLYWRTTHSQTCHKSHRVVDDIFNFRVGKLKQDLVQTMSSENIKLAQRIPLRILLAEDNVINQKLGLKVLEKLGYKADLASNGEEVLEACNHKTFDLIFMDVMMPVMDGIEATKLLNKKYHNAPDRPLIIALTAHAMPGEREKCLKMGMDDYLAKPLLVEKLKILIEEWALKMDPGTDRQ
jgi:CheY-like chemotaxis protein